LASESPRSRYSGRPGLPTPGPDNAANHSRHLCCRATSLTSPKCQLWTCQSCTNPAGAEFEPEPLQHGPPLRYAGPDPSGPDRQASVWRCHCLARAPFAHRINAVCILNGTATPTAVLGEDLSGSSPDGSAFNTHGPFLVLCAARNTRDTPVRDVPEGES